MSLDTKRHDMLFNKEAFDKPVHIIGVGGVGSHVVLELAKLGVGTHPQNTVDFYDGDIIEPHNVSSQAYGTKRIGMPKVEALSHQFTSWSDGNVGVPHPHFVEGRIPLSGVVFSCLDTMQARKDICEASIWRNPDITLFIETRMDANNAIVFAFDPNNEDHIGIWEEYWFPDSEANDEAGGCGSHQSAITAVTITASLAVQQMIHFAKKSNEFANHLRLTFSPWELKASVW